MSGKHPVPGENRREVLTEQFQSALGSLPSLPIDHALHALQYFKIKNKI